MHNGTIIGNTATAGHGGGVHIGGATSSFTMHNGTISGNHEVHAAVGLMPQALLL